MEITCSRCHQTVDGGASYCQVCGLPQLVYSDENSDGQSKPERWNHAVRDAASIDWKSALRLSAALALPAGILCTLLSPLNILALVVMAAAAVWVVALYMRIQRPAWITIGAGARLGLVTGVLGSWIAAAVTGLALFAARYWFHSGKVIDDFWDSMVNQQMVQQWSAMGVDPQAAAITKAWILSPQGRAGGVLGTLAFLVAGLLVFAVAGGALGARFLGRRRRPEI